MEDEKYLIVLGNEQGIYDKQDVDEHYDELKGAGAKIYRGTPTGTFTVSVGDQKDDSWTQEDIDFGFANLQARYKDATYEPNYEWDKDEYSKEAPAAPADGYKAAPGKYTDPNAPESEFPAGRPVQAPQKEEGAPLPKWQADIMANEVAKMSQRAASIGAQFDSDETRLQKDMELASNLSTDIENLKAGKRSAGDRDTKKAYKSVARERQTQLDEVLSRIDQNPAYAKKLEDETKAVNEKQEALQELRAKTYDNLVKTYGKDNMQYIAVQNDPGMMNTETAGRLYDDALQIINAPLEFADRQKGDKNREFFKGMGDDMKNPDFWTLGLTNIEDKIIIRQALLALQDAAGKATVKELETLDELDLDDTTKAVIDAYFTAEAANVLRALDTSRAYKNGIGGAESIKFMAEMALTAGLGKAATKGLTDKMVKYFGQKLSQMAPQALMGNATKWALRQGAKLTVGQANALAKAGVMTLAQPVTYENIAERAAQVDEWGKVVPLGQAVKTGGADQFIETWTEMTGELPGEFLGAAFDGVARALGTTAKGKALVSAMRNAPARLVGQKARMLVRGSKGLANIGWNNAGEYFEELLGAGIRDITGLEPGATDEFFQVQNLLDMTATFAPMGAIGLLTGGANVGRSIHYANRLKGMENKLRTLVGDTNHDNKGLDRFFDKYYRWLDGRAEEMGYGQASELTAQDMTADFLAFYKEHSSEFDSEGKGRLLDGIADFIKTAQEAQVIKGAEEADIDADGQQAFSEMQNQVGRNITYQGTDGFPGMEVVVGTSQNGQFFVVGDATDTGEVPVVYMDGRTGFERVGEIMAQGYAPGEYGKSLASAQKQASEQERVTAETQGQVSGIMDSFQQRYPVGATANELLANVYQMNGETVPEWIAGGDVLVESMNEQGVTFMNEKGASVQMSWEELAPAVGGSIEVKTDEDMANEEAGRLDAEDEARDLTAIQLDQSIANGIVFEQTGEQVVSIIKGSINLQDGTVKATLRDRDGNERVTTINYGEILSKQQAQEAVEQTAEAETTAETPVETIEEAPAEEKPAYETPMKDGEVDWDRMLEENPAEFARQLDELNGGDSTMSRSAISARLKELKEKLSKTKPTKVNEIMKLKAQIKALEEVQKSYLAQNAPRFQERPEKKAEEVELAPGFEGIVQKFNEAQKKTGFAHTKTLPNGTKLKGHYVLTDANAVTASHDPANGWQPTEGFPLSGGQVANSRDYTKPANRTDTEMMAQNYNSLALDNIPTVTPDGIVVDGNGRTMASQLAAKNGTDAEYVQALKEEAQRFGFTAEDVDEFDHPRVVFVTDETLPYDVGTFDMFNARETKRESKSESANKIGRLLDLNKNANVVANIASYMDQFDTVAQFYEDPTAVKEVFNLLVQAGVFSEKDRQVYISGKDGTATDEGRAAMNNVFLGIALDKNAIEILVDVQGMGKVAEKIIKALPSIIENAAMSEKFNFKKQLSSAIELIYRAKQAFGDSKDPMRDYIMSPQIELDGAFPYEDEAVQYLAQALLNDSPNEFKNDLAAYNDSVRNEDQGVGSFDFGDNAEPVTMESSLKNAIFTRKGKEYEPVKNQNEESDNEGSPETGARQQVGEEGRSAVPAGDEIGAGESIPGAAAGNQEQPEEAEPAGAAHEGRADEAGNARPGAGETGAVEAEPEDEHPTVESIFAEEEQGPVEEAQKEPAPAEKISEKTSESPKESVSSQKNEAPAESVEPEAPEQLTEEQIRNSGYPDENVIESAVDYINGDNSVQAQLGYLTIEDYVRSHSQTTDAGSRSADQTQLPRESAENGAAPAELGGGEAGQVVSEPVGESGRTDNPEQNPPVLPGERGADVVPGAQPGRNAVHSGSGDGRGRGVSGADGAQRDTEPGEPATGSLFDAADQGRNDQAAPSNTDAGSLDEAALGEELRGLLDQLDSTSPKVADRKITVDNILDAVSKFVAPQQGQPTASDAPLSSKRAKKIPAPLSLTGMEPKKALLLGKIMFASAKAGYAHAVNSTETTLNDFSRWFKKNFGQVVTEKLGEESVEPLILAAWDTKLKIHDKRLTLAEYVENMRNLELKLSSDIEKNLSEQKRVNKDKGAIKLADRKDIRETLPALNPGQWDDVALAERQFFSPEHQDYDHANGKGVLITNGTGTGKTFTGMGVIKRFLRQGKGRILLVTPANMVPDWTKTAELFGVTLDRLENTKDKGEGVIITSYENFRSNKELYKDAFDLVVYDEAQKIIYGQEGAETLAYIAHRRITNKNVDEATDRLVYNTPTGQQKLALEQEKDKLAREAKKKTITTQRSNEIIIRQREIDEELKAVESAIELIKPGLRKQAEEDVKRTKVLMLSASPFNTVENLKFAEGYIFNYPKVYRSDGTENTKAGKAAFDAEWFGGESIERDEIEFADHLIDELETVQFRELENGYDHSRDFPDVSGMVMAERFNQAWEAINNNNQFAPLLAHAKFLTDYAWTSQLFESMKASALKDRIQEHLDAGRKIVLFHNRLHETKTVTDDEGSIKKPPVGPPFATLLKQASGDGNAAVAITMFQMQFLDVLDWESKLDYRPVPDQMIDLFATPADRAKYNKEMAAYEKERERWEKEANEAVLNGQEPKPAPKEPKLQAESICLFNGEMTEKQKNESKALFNDDNSKKKIIIVTTASGGAGLSLHDTTGKHQRVMIQTSLPNSPIGFIQAEGRIFRFGNKSNAVFEYPRLGLNLEAFVFAMNFNKKVGTTENLAHGTRGRGFKDSIMTGFYENAGIVPIAGQGIGGVELDRRGSSLKDMAKALHDYEVSQRKGIASDDCAVPEPVGYKMAQWAKAESGENVIVPYAGRGSIPRYVDPGVSILALESNTALQTKMAITAGREELNIKDTPFDQLHQGANKADILFFQGKTNDYAMPPFITFAKAYQHVNEGGRLIAVLPDTDEVEATISNLGPSATKRISIKVAPNILGEDAKRIVVVDRISNPKLRAKATTNDIDLSQTTDQLAFFKAIDMVEAPERIVDKLAVAIRKVKAMVPQLKESSFVDNIDVASTGHVSIYYKTKKGFAQAKKKLDDFTVSGRGYYRGKYDWFNLKDFQNQSQENKYVQAYTRIKELIQEDDETLRYHVSFDRDVNEETIAEYRKLLNLYIKFIRAAFGLNDSQMMRVASGLQADVSAADINTIGSLTELREKFQAAVDDDEEYLQMFDDVLKVAEVFDVQAQSYQESGNFLGEYNNRTNTIRLNTLQWNRLPNSARTQTCLHEMIHSVTVYAIQGAKVGAEGMSDALYNAANSVLTVYKQLQKGLPEHVRPFSGYALQNEKELIAEMANPEVRDKLKARPMWTRETPRGTIVSGAEQEGFEKTTAWDLLKLSLYDILNNYDQALFDRFRKRSSDVFFSLDRNGRTLESDGGVRFSFGPEEREEIFISNAQAAVEALKMEKATPEQWKKTLEKNGGLKAAEDKWIGLTDWLDGLDKKTVTKQEVLDYINENKIQVEEQRYYEEGNFGPFWEKYPDFDEAFAIDEDEFRGGPIATVSNLEKAVSYYNKYSGGKKIEIVDGDVSDDEYRRMEDFARSFITRESETINSARLSYSTEGLDNKREIALTVPTIEPWNESDKIHFGDAGDGRAIAWVRFGDSVSLNTDKPMSEDDRYDLGKRLRQAIQAKDEAERALGRGLRGKMLDEQNEKLANAEQVISNLSQEYNLPNGKEYNRVLVIDEIQSKRHQEAREKGYKITEEEAAKHNVFRRISPDQTYSYYTDAEGYQLSPIGVPSVDGLPGARIPSDEQKKYMDALTDQRRDYEQFPPAAPFEKNWHELAMKRMLRLAAEEGYDYVAWTTGEQQADRYSLGGMVSKISVSPVDDGTREVTIESAGADIYLDVDENGKIVGQQDNYGENLRGKNLSEVVGKEMAVKIMNADEGTTFKGDGLRVGGEGMKGFYDDILPRFMNKYGKKWGVSVEDVYLPNVEQEARTMHAVRITPEMRESVLQGQPMFMMDGPKTGVTGPRAEVEAAATSFGASLQVSVVFEDGAPKYARNIKGRMVEPMGWYDTNDGSIHLNMARVKTSEQAESVILHEAVGHYGLRALFGKNFNTFLDNVYSGATQGIKDSIDSISKERNLNRRDATEEYLAMLAEDGFTDAEERSFWQKVKDWFLELLQSAGVLPVELTDADLRYILWESKRNLEQGDALQNAENAVTRAQLRNEAEESHEEPVDRIAEIAKDISGLSRFDEKYNEIQERKAEAVRQRFNEIKFDDYDLDVSTRAGFVEVARAKGVPEEEISAHLLAIEMGAAGVTFNNGSSLAISDNIESNEEADSVYYHERIHDKVNQEGPEFLKEAVKALGVLGGDEKLTHDLLLDNIKRLSHAEVYDNRSNEDLAEEVIAYVLQKAYLGQEISDICREAGITTRGEKFLKDYYEKTNDSHRAVSVPPYRGGNGGSQQNPSGSSGVQAKRRAYAESALNGQGPAIDREYLAAVKRGDLETAQRIIDEIAQQRLDEFNALQSDSETVTYKYHRGPMPKNTRVVYKAFNVDELGGLHSTYAGIVDAIPFGVWLDAQPMDYVVSPKNGRRYIPGTTGNSPSSLGLPAPKAPYTSYLSYRPAFHASSVPWPGQMRVKGPDTDAKKNEYRYLPNNKLIFKVEVAADIDYESKAEEFTEKLRKEAKERGDNGTIRKQLWEVPVGGHYTYNNGGEEWVLAGTFRIVGVLSEKEIRELNEKAGKPNSGPTQLLWIGGYHPEKFGLTDARVTAAVDEGMNSKLLDAVTYDDNGGIIPPSRRFDPLVNDIRFSFGEVKDKPSRASRILRTVHTSNEQWNIARHLYNMMVNTPEVLMKEQYQNMYEAVKVLMEAIETESGKKARDFEDFRLVSSAVPSKNKRDHEIFGERYLDPMNKAISSITELDGVDYDDVVKYAELKHGLERNIEMAKRAAMADYQAEYTKESQKILAENKALKKQMERMTDKVSYEGLTAKEQDKYDELALKYKENEEALQELMDNLQEHRKALYPKEYYRDAHEAAIKKIKADASLTNNEKQQKIDEENRAYEARMADIENNPKKYEAIRDKDVRFSHYRGTDGEKNNYGTDYAAIRSWFSEYQDSEGNPLHETPARLSSETKDEYNSRLRDLRHVMDGAKSITGAEAMAQAWIDEFEKKIGKDSYEGLWKAVNAATDWILKHQLDNHTISREQYEALSARFKYYVPLRGFAEDTAEDLWNYGQEDHSGDFAAPLLPMQGRQSKPAAPFAYIATMADTAIVTDNRNSMRRALYRFVANRPDNSLVTIADSWYVNTHQEDEEGHEIWAPQYPNYRPGMTLDEMRAERDRFEAEMKEQAAAGEAILGSKGVNLRGAVAHIDSQDRDKHLVKVLMFGKEHFLIVNGNPRAALALNGQLNIESLNNNAILRFFRDVTRIMSMANTGLSPSFWFANFAKDFLTGTFNTIINEDARYTMNFEKNYAVAVSLLPTILKEGKFVDNPHWTERTRARMKKYSELYSMYLNHGGPTGFTTISNIEQYESLIRSASKKNKSETVEKIKRLWNGITQVGKIGEALEQVPRFAAFLTSMESGRSIERSIRDAKDVTLDFNTKGAASGVSRQQIKQLQKVDKNGNIRNLTALEKAYFYAIANLAPSARSFIMFFNPAVQGVDKMIRNFKADKNKATAVTGALVFAGIARAILASLFPPDDENEYSYNDLNEYRKRTNFVIPVGPIDILWPISQEFAPFYALGDIIAETLLKRNGPSDKPVLEAMSALGGILPLNPFSPEDFVPDLLSPILEVMRNRNFMGSYIYYDYASNKELPNYTKAPESTWGWLVDASQMLNEWTGGDYARKGWLDINPAVVQHLAEGVGGGILRDLGNLTQEVENIATGNDYKLRNTMILRRFALDPSEYRNAYVYDQYSQYYNAAMEAKRLHAKYKDDVVRQIELEDSKEWEYYQIFKSYESEIKNLRKERDAAEDARERADITFQLDVVMSEFVSECSEAFHSKGKLLNRKQ